MFGRCFKKFGSLVAVAAFSTGTFWAQNGEKLRLTVDDAVKMALESNLSLKRADITLKGLERSFKTSFGAFTPNVSAGVSFSSPNKKPEMSMTTYSIVDDNVVPQSVSLGEAYQSTVTASFNVSLTLTAATFANIVTTHYALKAGETSHEIAKRSIELSTRKAFAQLIYLQQSVESQKRNLDLLKSQYEQSRARYAAGRMAELDMLSSQANYETAKPIVLAAESGFLNALDAFKQILAVDAEAEIEIDGTLDGMLDLGELDFEAAAGKSLSVEAAERNVKMLKSAKTAAIFNSFCPSVTVGWSHLPSATNKTLDDGLKDTAGAFSLSATLSLTGFLPWSQAFQQTWNARDALKQAQMELEDAKRQTDIASKTNRRAVIQSQVSIDSLKVSKNLSQRAYEMTRIAYNSGQRTFLELSTAMENRLKSEVNLVNGALSLYDAILDYENCLNLPFGTLIEMQKKAESERE